MAGASWVALVWLAALLTCNSMKTAVPATVVPARHLCPDCPSGLYDAYALHALQARVGLRMPWWSFQEGFAGLRDAAGFSGSSAEVGLVCFLPLSFFSLLLRGVGSSMWMTAWPVFYCWRNPEHMLVLQPSCAATW